MKVFAGSDLHCGHDSGLTPIEYNWTPPENAIPLEHKMFKFRQFAWQWFKDKIAEFGPFEIGLWNGDLVDGAGDKSGGKEDMEIPAQVEMAAHVIRYVGAKKNYITRGTPYHVGNGKMTWEDMVSNMVGGQIENEGHYKINGLLVNMKHKIGNSSSPISQFTALSSARIRQMLWADSGQQAKANLILRAHIHRCQSIMEPGRNFSAWTMPALQGLGSVFGARNVDGLPVHFGFLVLDIESEHKWKVSACLLPMDAQKAHITVIGDD